MKFNALQKLLGGTESISLTITLHFLLYDTESAMAVLGPFFTAVKKKKSILKEAPKLNSVGIIKVQWHRGPVNL